MKTCVYTLIAFIVLALGFRMAQAADPVVTDLTKCSLQWNASTGSPDSYVVYLGEPGKPAVPIGATSELTFPCASFGIEADGDYFVQVSAKNIKGESARTAALPFTVDTLTIPGVPENPRLVQ